MSMSAEKNIFQGIKKFQNEYKQAVNKKQRQVRTLREIGGRGAEQLIQDIQIRFNDTIHEMQKRHGASVRHYVSMIEDETVKKKVRYKVNLCIRCPEKCGTFETAQEFYQWCGVGDIFFLSYILTDEVNKPP